MSDVERIRDTYLIDDGYTFDTVQFHSLKNEMIRTLLDVMKAKLIEEDGDEFFELYTKILKLIS